MVSFQHVCEPCRQALNLPAERSYLNRIKRRSGGFSTSGAPSTQPQREVWKRDTTGKPLIIGFRHSDHFAGTNSLCVCHCTSNGHDPWQCTGEDDFPIGGRPGSGFVDKLADQLGIEPIPELVQSQHEECAALVRVMLAWMEGGTDEERHALEADLEKLRYEDQVRRLRDRLQEKLPELSQDPPYRDLKSNLKKLAAFRDKKVAHSWPTGGDYFLRTKRVKGEYVTISTTPEEVAAHLDLGVALKSQLSFLPVYLDRQKSAEALSSAQVRNTSSGVGAGTPGLGLMRWWIPLLPAQRRTEAGCSRTALRLWFQAASAQQAGPRAVQQTITATPSTASTRYRTPTFPNDP